jgi:hypothetical protein
VCEWRAEWWWGGKVCGGGGIWGLIGEQYLDRGATRSAGEAVSEVRGQPEDQGAVRRMFHGVQSHDVVVSACGEPVPVGAPFNGCHRGAGVG